MSTEDALLLLKPPFGYIRSHINISFHFVNSFILSKSSPWAFPTFLQYSGRIRSDIFIFLLSTAEFLTSQFYSACLHVLCSSLVLTCVQPPIRLLLLCSSRLLPECQLACGLASSALPFTVLCQRCSYALAAAIIIMLYRGKQHSGLFVFL